MDFVVTCLPKQGLLPPSILSDISEFLERETVQIVSIYVLSISDADGCLDGLQYYVQTEISVDSLKQNLRDRYVDVNFVILQKENVAAIKLIGLDFDSTIIQQETIDLMAEKLPLEHQRAIEVITKRAMNGEYDYESSLRCRLKYFQGLDVKETFAHVQRYVTLRRGMKGLIKICKDLAVDTVIVSGGFSYIVQWMQEILKMDYSYANVLETCVHARDDHEILNKDSRVVFTGELIGGCFGPQDKLTIIQQHQTQKGLLTKQVMTVGDGANDIPMLEAFPAGLAFNAKPVVKQLSPNWVDLQCMLALVFLLDPFNESRLFHRKLVEKSGVLTESDTNQV